MLWQGLGAPPSGPSRLAATDAPSRNSNPDPRLAPSERDRAEVDLQRVPDEIAILRFRHLLDGHACKLALLPRSLNFQRRKAGSFWEGTLVDAAILDAPTSTKNQQHTRTRPRRESSDLAS